jgi:tRNA U34 5-methylaminomethyl-2-thiouridine-forming methyltransferase MnmC
MRAWEEMTLRRIPQKTEAVFLNGFSSACNLHWTHNLCPLQALNRWTPATAGVTALTRRF